ncbi:unnamed protein product, partial [Symbiodinium pilosum]
LPFPACLVVRAARALRPEDELTCTYIEVRAPHFVRRAELESTWGFECNCGRCLLESKVWTADPEAGKAARSLWRRFERRRKEGACSEEELREIVAEAERLTASALSGFLQTATEEDFQKEAQSYRNAVGYPNSSSPGAFTALRDLLLGSLWVAPAWELAFGLQDVEIWKFESIFQNFTS